MSRLLPSEEGFDGEAYLAVFHAASTAGELAAGLRALERELGESTGQLKQLVSTLGLKHVILVLNVFVLYDFTQCALCF